MRTRYLGDQYGVSIEGQLCSRCRTSNGLWVSTGQTRRWRISTHPRSEHLDDDLLERIQVVFEDHPEIETLTNKRPNWIDRFDASGIWVETLRSRRLGTAPQLVPAWMIVAAWDRLKARGELSHDELLNELNVKRSAFVMALLAQFPDVVVRSTYPTVIAITRTTGHP
ncbi:hypothetical protein ABQF26_02370 [Mycolicibacterium elephantis]